MLEELIGANLMRAVGGLQNITEIRLRIGRPLLVCTVSGEHIRPKQTGAYYIVSRKDIDFVLSRATNMSVYSASDEMTKGYIPATHYRIGIGGEGVMNGDKLVNVKNISYLVIRIPHQIKDAADRIREYVFEKAGERLFARNTLVISPTGAGKTTLLRELARIASESFNVVVIDERYELCAVSKGVPALDVGDVEIVSGTPKIIAYENCVRAMNPDIIVTDELFSEKEVYAVCDIIRSGVKVFASIHGENVESIEKSRVFGELINKFDFAVTLGKNPVGRFVEKVRL